MKYFLCKFGLSFSGGARVVTSNGMSNTSTQFRQLIVAHTEDFEQANASKIVEELSYDEAVAFVDEHINSKRTYFEPVFEYQKDENDEFILDEAGEKIVALDEEGSPIIAEQIEKQRPLYTLPRE